MMQKWRIVKTQVVFQTPFFSIRQDTCRLPDGKVIDDYYVMQSPNVVIVFPITPNHEVVLVEQYKHGLGDVLLELPGGLIDDDDESPIIAAKREFNEETGYDGEFFPLMKFAHDPTRSSRWIYAFLALDVELQGSQQLDANEAIDLHLVPLEKMPELLIGSRIATADSIAICWQALHYLREKGITQ